MTARRTTTAKTNRTLKAVPNDAQPTKHTRKPAATSAAKAPAKKTAARKPAAKPATTKAGAVEKLSTDIDASSPLPTDGTELRKLQKITRDRRWRAGKRDDAALVESMNELLGRIDAAIKGEPAKQTAASKPATKKAVPARKTTAAARKTTSARKS